MMKSGVGVGIRSSVKLGGRRRWYGSCIGRMSEWGVCLRSSGGCSYRRELHVDTRKAEEELYIHKNYKKGLGERGPLGSWPSDQQKSSGSSTVIACGSWPFERGPRELCVCVKLV